MSGVTLLLLFSTQSSVAVIELRPQGLLQTLVPLKLGSMFLNALYFIFVLFGIPRPGRKKTSRLALLCEPMDHLEGNLLESCIKHVTSHHSACVRRLHSDSMRVFKAEPCASRSRSASHRLLGCQLLQARIRM